jgi:hypothetical protein
MTFYIIKVDFCIFLDIMEPHDNGLIVGGMVVSCFGASGLMENSRPL